MHTSKVSDSFPTSHWQAGIQPSPKNKALSQVTEKTNVIMSNGPLFLFLLSGLYAEHVSMWYGISY